LAKPSDNNSTKTFYINMFGKRDPAQYGTITLDEINQQIKELEKELGCTLEIFERNSSHPLKCSSIVPDPALHIIPNIR
jgi:hypothetical protein